MKTAFVLTLVLLLCAAWLGADDWPRWRGPDGTGHVPNGVAVPATLPAAPKVIWRIPIGDGFASPVVSAGRAFYLDNQQGKETVHAADAADGKVLWSVPLDQAFKDAQTVPGPRCAPVVDEQRLYAQSCRGELQCLNVADGKLLWRANFVNDFGAVFIGETGSAAGARRHGYTGPPVVDGGRIIVGVGGANGAGVVCFDKHNGAVIWKSQNDIPGYAGPVVATIAGVKQIVCFTAEAVIGLDGGDGKLLWRWPVKTSLGRHVTTPVIVDDMVMVASFQVGLLGIRISKEGGGFKAERAWVAKESAMNFSSPVAVGKHLYGLGPARNLICVDVETGKQAWSREGYSTAGADKAHASLLVMGRNILVLTDGGELILMEADPGQCREIGRTQVCGRNWCNPAYADGRLFLRDARELCCVQLLP